MIDLFYPPIPEKIEPTFVHIMPGKWANPEVTPERYAQMAEYNRTRRKKMTEYHAAYREKNLEKIRKRQREWKRGRL